MLGAIMGEEVKVGMLTKRAQKKKSIGPVNYKDRVFVLTDRKLSYFEGNLQQRGKIKESFGVDTISFVGPINDNALNRTSAFQIIHNDCYLYCCAKGGRDRDEWIEAIQKVCETHSKSLQTMYHPSIYNSGKWQCCGKTDRNNRGCESINSCNAKGYNKPLPQPPRDLGVPGLSNRLSLSSQVINFHQPNSINTQIPVPLKSDVFPKVPPKPANMVNKGFNSHQLEDNPERSPAWNFSHPSSSGTLPKLLENNANAHRAKCNSLSNQGQKTLSPVKSQVSSSQKSKYPHTMNLENFNHINRLSVAPESAALNYKLNRELPAAAYPSYNASKGGIHTPSKSYEFTSPQAPPVSRPQASPDKIIAIALYDFQPVEHDDIELRTGERYTVLNTSRPHWWKVRNSYGHEGFVPANYLKDEKSDGLETMSWFQKDISRQRAEYLLKEGGKEGTFIVRNSSQQSVIYTLSVISKCGSVNGPIIVKHYHIKKNEQGQVYLSEKHPMTSIVDLIEYHKHNAGGLVTRLRQAPSVLDGEERIVHLFSNSNWEIDMNELELQKELGSGQFGVVRLALMRRKIYVAVKIMKEGTMSEDSFIEEAEVMTRLKHKNLVELYGVVIKQRPICIVTEYMENGCLLEYIRKNSHLQTHPANLLDMCYQVCDAMKYLEGMNMIHRDLAARNCLVGKNMLIKVADFGLTRYVLDDEYTSSLGSKFPIKWAAPEVLNYTKFSSKSDVWAFGVLMWELFTGGKMPYRALGNAEVVDRVASGLRLERPASCPHDVYYLMLKTWDKEPEKRPSFSDMFVTFDDLIDTVHASCTPEGMYDA